MFMDENQAKTMPVLPSGQIPKIIEENQAKTMPDPPSGQIFRILSPSPDENGTFGLIYKLEAVTTSTPSGSGFRSLQYHHLIQEYVLFLSEEEAHRGPFHLGPASSQVTQQLHFPTNPQSQSQSQSHLQSHQEKQQSQPVYPWSAHASPFGQSPSPFLRKAHALSTSATPAGELFLFGGYVHKSKSPSNDLYVISTRDFSTTLLQTSGDVPSPRYGHRAVLTRTTLLTWGGEMGSGDQSARNQSNDDSVYLLDLGTFGGGAGKHYFNDTWSFNISTRKWTELQCTGSIPSPCSSHTAVLIGDVMYVYGGRTVGRTILARRWSSFQDIGPSPCARAFHAIASDGRRVFVLGGQLSPGAQVDDAELIHVLDTTLLIYPKPDSNTVKHSEKTTQLGQKVSPGHPTDKYGVFSSLDVGGAHGASFPFQISTFEDMGHPASPQISREQNPSLMEDNDSESSTERLTNLVTPDTSFEKDVARLEHVRIADLERQLSETLAAQSKRGLRISQLTDQLVQKNALLELAEANAAEAKKRAGLEQRELQAKLDESLLSRDQALKQAQSALREASWAAEFNEHSQRELTEMRAELEARKSELAAFHVRLADTENGCAKSKAEADTGLRELRAKLDESLLSRDHALEQAQSALQEASCAAEVNEQSQRELTEMRAELEARKSESVAFRLRLADTENGYAKSKAEALTGLRELQAKLDESLLSRDHALEQAQSACREHPAPLKPMSKPTRTCRGARRARGEGIRIGGIPLATRGHGEWLRELQVKLDVSLLSRDHALEQTQSALQRASCAAEANEQSQRELAELHAKLEARESELAAFRSRLAETENGCTKGKAEADSYRNQNTTSLVNTDEDRIVHRLMERMQAMEAEMASLRWNEKSFEMMECRNEDKWTF
ncbi:hypothetical protein BGY98DRAFT_1174113 [Russula aff. rugulosa BPL654]|nr:hypothetical protein BGY98DRAFT_1174113 [Russula aff. rugulosa BPL654]